MISSKSRCGTRACPRNESISRSTQPRTESRSGTKSLEGFITTSFPIGLGLQPLTWIAPTVYGSGAVIYTQGTTTTGTSSITVPATTSYGFSTSEWTFS